MRKSERVIAKVMLGQPGETSLVYVRLLERVKKGLKDLDFITTGYVIQIENEAGEVLRTFGGMPGFMAYDDSHTRQAVLRDFAITLLRLT